MTTALESTLRRVAKRRNARRRVRAVAWGIAPLLAGVIVVVGLDAAWPMGAWARVGAVAVVGALALHAIVRVWWRRVDEQAALRDAGGALERAGAAPAGSIVGALELGRREQGDPLGEALAAKAAERAAGCIGDADAARAAEEIPVRSAALAIALVALACALPLALVPNLAGREWARLSDPFGDDPAWTVLRFVVDAEPRRVLVGDDVRIGARVTGGEVGEAALELEGGVRIRMERMEEGVFAVELRGVREDVRAQVVTARGRSAWVGVEVRREPRIVAASARVIGMDGAARGVEIGAPGFEGEASAEVGETVELSVVATMELAGGDGVEASGRGAVRRVELREAGDVVVELAARSRESGIESARSAAVRVRVVERAALEESAGGGEGPAIGAAGEGGERAGEAEEGAQAARSDAEEERDGAPSRGAQGLEAGGDRDAGVGEGGDAEGDRESAAEEARAGEAGDVEFVEPEREDVVEGVREEAGERATGGVGAGGGGDGLKDVPRAYRDAARAYLEAVARLRGGL